MTAAEPWVATAPIPLDVAEGPDAWAAIQAQREQIKGCALLEGVDPDHLQFRLIAPARVQGKPIPVGYCPITGDPIPSPYMLRATTTIQENQT